MGYEVPHTWVFEDFLLADRLNVYTENDKYFKQRTGPMCWAYLSDFQDILLLHTTLVELDAEVYDIGDNFDIATHRFVAPKNGYYEMIGTVVYASPKTGRRYRCQIKKGGTDILQKGYAHAAVSEMLSTRVHVIDHLNIGDFIELKTWHTGDATERIMKSKYETSLIIYLLAED